MIMIIIIVTTITIVIILTIITTLTIITIIINNRTITIHYMLLDIPIPWLLWVLEMFDGFHV